MIPRRICLEDFMSHGRTEIDCTAFDSILIVGQNKNNLRESNGVGKTTIFYAIDYVLFGVVPSDTIDEIIRVQSHFPNYCLRLIHVHFVEQPRHVKW